jgi:hypothetical protein
MPYAVSQPMNTRESLSGGELAGAWNWPLNSKAQVYYHEALPLQLLYDIVR